MAGTIYGIPLSQRVDLNGQPSIGWLLYLYQANTSTPVNSYQDTALTILNPWPLQADSYGMMRQFWLADGTYRARATNADASVVYFDLPAVLALGPSAGAAPSGGVDPAAIFQTGDLIWLDRQGTRSGWVRDNGKTIGNSTSGATEPNGAGAGAQPLYEFLWNNFADTICPVIGGRGASAVADFNFPKQLTLPDKRGFIPCGLDDMGNTAIGRFANVPVIRGSVTAAGSWVGENSRTLTVAQMPTHGHNAWIYDPTHSHTATLNGVMPSAGQVFQGSGTGGGGNGTPTCAIGASGTGVRISADAVNPTDTVQASGGGQPYNNVPFSVLGTFYRKL